MCRLGTAMMFAVCSLHGQTFVVDAGNGPGANFTSIAAAIAAVPDGATLLVRAGTYAPFTVDAKGLTILGDPGVVVGGSVAVRNIAAGQAVTIRELQTSPGAVLVDNCA